MPTSFSVVLLARCFPDIFAGGNFTYSVTKKKISGYELYMVHASRHRY